MYVKRKIIPIVHTNNSLYVTKLIRQSCNKGLLLKPGNYINRDMLNKILYTDIDHWYYQTYPMYLEYCGLQLDTETQFYFNKWDFYAWNIKLTNPATHLQPNSFFIGDIAGLAYYSQRSS